MCVITVTGSRERALGDDCHSADRVDLNRAALVVLPIWKHGPELDWLSDVLELRRLARSEFDVAKLV